MEHELYQGSESSDATAPAVNEDLIRRQISPGFDVQETSASATLLATGHDVRIDEQGYLTLEQTPSVSLAHGKQSSADWQFRMRLASLQREDGLTSIGEPTSLQVNGSEVSLEYASGTNVIYEHTNRGLEQRLNVSKRPAGQEPLVVRFETSDQFTYQLEDDDTSVRVYLEGHEVFAWRGLKVFDADGRRVPAQMEAKKGSLQYRIDDADARYPLLIDPLSTAPEWQTEGSQGFGLYGRAATIVGDVNNDGYEDALVGQPFYSNPENREGRTLLFLGSASGLSSTSSWAAESDQASAFFGLSLTGLGDVDNDGFDDTAISAILHDSNGFTNNGRVYMFRGNTNGLDLSPSWTASSDQGGANFGIGIAGMGDLNCDGIPDLAVGASGYDGSGDGTGSGRVYIYYGSTSSPYLSSAADTIDELNNESLFGRNLYIRGNVDGDPNNCDDLLVGAPGYTNTLSGEGRAQVYLGATSGIETTATWTAYGGQAAAAFGSYVTLVDVTGDGLADALVSADKFNTAGGSNRGKVFAFHGTSSGPSTTPDWSHEGDQDSAAFGTTIIPLPDVNNDGYGDVVITAPVYTDQVSNEGAAFGFLGSASGLSAAALWETYSGESNSRFGFMTMSMGGDINGDGYSDLLIGAMLADDGVVDGGTAFAFHGQPTCYINGAIYQDGETNTSNTCEVCDVSTDVLSWTTLSDGATCDDGSACTSSDTCQSGTCQGTQSTTCNDGNPCTSDTCDAATGQCVADSTADGNPCTDDGLACTSDLCDNGTCAHVIDAVSCVINDTCYADGDFNPSNRCEVCDASSSQTSWSASPSGASCDDGRFCTVGETCDGNKTCTGGQPRDCSGAITQCTTGAQCSELAAQCVTTGDEADGTSCDDGSGCTTNDVCTDGSCGGAPVVCTNSNPCEAGSCDPSTGNCTFTAIANGTACTPANNACQVGMCQSGVCSTTGQISCEDNNPCTADSCDPSTGCQNDPLSAGTACSQAACVDDTTAAPAATCDASATCIQASTVDCGSFRCSSGACRTSCTTDGHCADDAWCDVSTNECSTENRAPEADAGNDQIADEAMSVTLDGTGSSDVDGDTLTYKWDQISGTDVTLDDSESPTPAFTAPAIMGNDADDELIFELVVNDGTDDSAPDTVTVLIRDSDNAAPTAVITGPDEAESGQTITLSGADSSDSDGDDLQFRWSRASGRPLPILGGSNAEDFEITFPEVTTETSYSFLLLVNDGNVNSTPAIHEVVVTPAQTGGDAGPGADAGDAGDSGHNVDNRAGDLSGSSCACDSVQREEPTAPVWLLGAMFLGGFAIWRRRRWFS